MPVTTLPRLLPERQRLISEIVRVHRAQPGPPCACQNGTAECYVTEAFEAATIAQLEVILAGERADRELPAEAAGRTLYQLCGAHLTPWGDLPLKIRELWTGRAAIVVRAEHDAHPPSWAAPDLI
jgi:hypothetical protein